MPSRSNWRPIASASALRPLIGRTITVSSPTLPSSSKRSRSSPSTLPVADPGAEDQRRGVARPRAGRRSGSPRTPSSRPRSGSSRRAAFPRTALKTTGLRKTTSSASAVGERLGVLGLDRGPESVALHRRAPYPACASRPGRRAARARRAAGRAAPATAREASISRSGRPRSSTPISSSIETRSSVEMFPVAPGVSGLPPELAERRLERVDPLLERGQHVGQPLAARVVEVGRQLDAVEPLAAPAAKNSRDLARVRHPGRVAEGDLLAAGLREPLGDLEHARRAAPRPRRDSRRPTEITPSQRSPSAARRARPSARGPSSDSAIERLTFLRLWVSDAERKTFTSSKRSRWASARSSPLLVRDQHRVARRRRAARSPPAPPSASESCGITSGRTNEVTSSRRSPRVGEHADQPHLVGGGDHLGLVLEPVARADLANPDAARRAAPAHGATAPTRT